MKIANNIIGNILGKSRLRGGKNDWDGDGVPNKKDCQPRNTMRQDSFRMSRSAKIKALIAAGEANSVQEAKAILEDMGE